jgi:ribose transport system ATP-binding protein
MPPFLEMQGITKSFPGVKALDGVDLALSRGEVHAVAGENGAGKSTLMKIMTGAYRANAGTITIEGVPVIIRDPEHARALGVSIIYQELSMVENLTVAENIFLAREPRTGLGFIDMRRMVEESRQVLARLQLDIDPRVIVDKLSIGQKQMIEIAKAISYNSKILVMDEPTASLSHREAETLIAVIKQLRAEDMGIVYISHRLEEIFEIADRVTVLRDGRSIATRPIGEVTREFLVKTMVDRELSELYGEHVSHAGKEVILSVSGLGLKRPSPHAARVADISFDLHKGEVLGFFGLIGAGRTEIMEMIFGERGHHGSIRVDGKPVTIRGPSDAIAAGIGFVTEDRKGQGLVLDMTVRENFSLTHLADYCSLDFVNRRREVAACSDSVRTFGVKTPSIEQKIVHLSGGNQQKVVIAKWVARRPRILIVDEPTRGIDIAAKSEVHRQLQGLAAQGLGVIAVSSDLAEILAISDRVIVVREGRISGELPRRDATREAVMNLATG